jgi:hypothetical protein
MILFFSKKAIAVSLAATRRHFKWSCQSIILLTYRVHSACKVSFLILSLQVDVSGHDLETEDFLARLTKDLF